MKLSFHLFAASWLLGIVDVESLEQYTPDEANWTTFQDKAAELYTDDHTPDGVGWIDQEEWIKWDGTVYDPTKYTKQEFKNLICIGGTVRGMHELFYDNNPFANIANPTKAEVDNWHAIVLNHVRAMVGYTEPEYTIIPDKCLHLRALWSDQRAHTRMWDTEAYPGTCEGSSAPHCGAGFIPSNEDQQAYLPEGIESCGARPGSEGLFNAAKSSIPWSIKWIRPFCATLGSEGFWGGHTGPWFHRSEFGWSWYDSNPIDVNSNANLRTKWSGTSATNKYENPDVTEMKFTVNEEDVSPSPRFPGYECASIEWSGKVDSATECYQRMMGDENCGKRFMTFNSLNFGCACYPTDLTVCEITKQPGRQTWDFEPIASSYDGLLIDTSKARSQNKLPYDNRECKNIMWKTKAGDASHCLQKIIENHSEDCGRDFITFNGNGGGCACYPPGQTCERRGGSLRRSGRQTYEVEVDPAYHP